MSCVRRASKRVISIALLVMATNPVRADEPPRVLVRGNGHDLGETPILVELGHPLPPGEYALTSTDAGPPLPAHVFADGGKTYLGVILGRAEKDEARTYTLRRDPKPEAGPPGVELRRDGGNVRVSLGGEPFTVYRTDAGPKPILYPLLGPTGAAMTRSYPMEAVRGEDQDHPHQRSFWFTHGKVNGVDFWTEAKGHGTIRETAKRTIAGGPAVGVLRTADEWIGPDGNRICRDERVLRFWDTRSARVLDFEVTIKATDGPVTFGDTKEGMFGVRVASSMDVTRKAGGRITNAEGRTDADAWGRPSPWVDYAGPVGGKTVGIAILNHPDSFRAPTTWHVRDYGLFAANPFGLHDFGRPERGDHAIPAGGSISFRYRVILHTGGTDSADLPHAYRSYATPPTVEIRGG